MAQTAELIAVFSVLSAAAADASRRHDTLFCEILTADRGGYLCPSLVPSDEIERSMI
jgi:hypothetical protein